MRLRCVICMYILEGYICGYRVIQDTPTVNAGFDTKA